MKQERYHEYLLRKAKEEREMAQIPLPFCQSDLERFGYTQCAHCGDLLHQDEAVVAVYYTDHQQEQEHFCGQHCKELRHINRLNTLGM